MWLLWGLFALGCSFPTDEGSFDSVVCPCGWDKEYYGEDSCASYDCPKDTGVVDDTDFDVYPWPGETMETSYQLAGQSQRTLTPVEGVSCEQRLKWNFRAPDVPADCPLCEMVSTVDREVVLDECAEYPIAPSTVAIGLHTESSQLLGTVQQ